VLVAKSYAAASKTPTEGVVGPPVRTLNRWAVAEESVSGIL
jgi:hypothetical protein